MTLKCDTQHIDRVLYAGEISLNAERHCAKCRGAALIPDEKLRHSHKRTSLHPRQCRHLAGDRTGSVLAKRVLDGAPF